MTVRTKTILLSYEGEYAKRTIHDSFFKYNIPLRHIDQYIPNTAPVYNDDLLTFKPTGKFAKLKGGERLEIWTTTPKQLSLT